MSEDEEGLKGASLIARSGGEQMARDGRNDMTGKGPMLVKCRKTEDVWIACVPLIRVL
jgi:hypothetical protein